MSTLQSANPAMGTVTRRPQTTAVAAQNQNVPFARLSRKGQILGPSTATFAMGGLWTPIMKPVGGYLRGLEFRIQAVTGGATATTASADAPYNVVQNLYFRDPF